MTEDEKRQRIERRIARRLILDGLAAGYTIKVDNGEEIITPKKQTAKAILAEMFSVDDERLLFYKDGKRIGNVWMVYGNDGWDVICDYHMVLEPIMAGADAESNKAQG